MSTWKEGESTEAILIVKKWNLSKRDAEEMNEGENPLYPWRVDRFQRADTGQKQERNAIGKWLRNQATSNDGLRIILTHLAAMIEDGDHHKETREDL